MSEKISESERHRLAMCGHEAVTQLGLDGHSDSPRDVRKAIEQLQNSNDAKERSNSGRITALADRVTAMERMVGELVDLRIKVLAEQAKRRESKTET